MIFNTYKQRDHVYAATLSVYGRLCLYNYICVLLPYKVIKFNHLLNPTNQILLFDDGDEEFFLNFIFLKYISRDDPPHRFSQFLLF